MKDNNFLLFDDEGEDTKNLKNAGADISQTNTGQKVLRFEEKVKLNLYNIFCYLLKSGLEIAPWKILIIVAIEFVQFLQFSFHPSMIDQWKNNAVINYISIASQVFSLRYWLDLANISWSDYLITFYVVVLFIFFIIINFLYASFSVSHQSHQLSFTWPLTLLQYVCLLMTTVLFQPILEMFLSMLACEQQTQITQVAQESAGYSSSSISGLNNRESVQQVQSLSVMSMFHEIECFQGTHILHSCVAIIVSIILIAINISIVFLYFESRRQTQIILSKINAKAEFIICLVKIILVVVFAFLQDNSFAGFKILILVVVSTITFLRYIMDRPYYSTSFNNVMITLQGIFAWTNYMILLGALLGNTRFNMLLIIYLLGVPIIITLILTMRADANMKILLTPLFKFQKGEEALDQVVELIHLIQTKDTNRESAILIKGFVNYHEMTCIEDDCHLKQYKRQMQNKNNGYGNGIRNAFNNEGGIQNSQNHQKYMASEGNSLLLNFTKKLLEKSIKKFPKCIILKITYSNFLLDHMGNKREAMKELNECSKLKPSVDQQFIIFRYKKLIGDSLIESGKESGGFEYISAVNYDANFRKCKLNIERSALLHFEFWNHLQEESPDLKRLMDLGIRIDQQLKIVEYHWEKMQQIYPNTHKAVKLYAMFLIEVVNDKEAGNELLLKAKDSSQIRTNFDFSGNAAAAVDEMGGSGLGLNMQDGSPLIYISGENDRMGIISSINLSACRVFGYFRKEELVNKNIKMLMPNIYAQHHDEFVRGACMKPPDQIANKERQVFGRHTSGYIFPVSLQIKFFQSFLHGKQFAATLKTEKKSINTSVAYLIIDSEGKVLEASSSAIHILMIDRMQNQHLKKRVVYDLSVLIEGLLDDKTRNQCLSKQGDRVLYSCPEVVDEGKDKRNTQEVEQQDNALENQKTGENDHSDSSSDDDDADPAAAQNLSKQRNQNSHHNNNRYQQNSLGGRNKSLKKEEGSAQQTYIKPSESKKAYLLCHMFPIGFTNVQGGEVQGYSVRLENQENDDEEAIKHFIKEKNIEDPLIKKLVKHNDFQFSFSPIYKKFVRELREDDNQDPLIDQAYMYVKKENQKRGEDGNKLTVMSYLNHLKIKLEKQEENNSAAMLGEGYIREVDEYSEETHSDDMAYTSSLTKKQMTRTMKNGDFEAAGGGISKYLTLNNTQGGKSMQKRINELINSRFMPGMETPEKLFEKIQEITEILKEKARAGEDVKTYRICDGEITLVEEVTGQFLIKNSEAAHVEVEDTTDEEVEEGESSNVKTSVKSRKAFQAQLNDKSIPPSVKNLQLTANIVLLIFIALSIIEYSVVRTDLQSIGTNYQAIQNRFQLISEMQRSSYHARSLVLYSKNIYSMNQTMLTLAKTDMKDSLNTIYQLQSQINLQKLSLSPPHQTLLDQKVVQMYFKQQENTTDIKALNFSLTEGLLQVSSSLFTLTNLDNNQFDDRQDDVFYFLYNNFQDTLSAMWKSANYFVSELHQRTSEINEANKMVFYLSIGCVIISVLMLIPVVHIVNKTKQRYLEVFLELDNNNIRKLSAKCEKYMNMVQDESNEELNSNDDELEDMARGGSDEGGEEEYSMSSGGRRSKKKRAKNTISNKRMFVIKFVIGMMIIEVYFFANYFVQSSFLTTCHILGNELNTTATVEPYFWFSLNAQRELYSDQNRPILGRKSYDVSREGIALVQQLGSDMQQQHLQNKGSASSTYNERFSESMLRSVCNLVDPEFSNYTGKSCEKFISGSTTQGLHSVIVRYEEDLRKVLSQYQQINRTSQVALSKLINSPELAELFNIQRFINSVHMQTIVSSLQSSVQTQVSSSLETRLAVFTLFIVLLLLLFVTVWIPFINGLSTEVHQTKRILLLIPLELLMSLKNVSNLINQEKTKKGGAPGTQTTGEAAAIKKATVVAPD